MVYAVDIGNTNMKVGKFVLGNLEKVDVYDIGKTNEWKTVLEQMKEEKMIVSSTSLSEKEVIKTCKLENAYRIQNTSQYPIRFNYERISDMGKDRIAASVGAYCLDKSKHSLVVDIGTCATYEVIEKSGVHLGGMISPGLEMRFKSMHKMTARLPLVADDEIFSHIATNTIEALRVGGKFGLLLEIEGYIRHVKKLFKDINIYLTGGNAEYMNENIEERVIIEKHLILKGLFQILKWNDKEV